MTREELLTALRLYRLGSNHDEEIAHKAADRALLEYINDPEVSEVFDSIRKWYA